MNDVTLSGEVAPEPRRALFELGQMVATPGALESLARFCIEPRVVLERHPTGDWGEMTAQDRIENMRAVGRRLRILSSYPLPDGGRIWVITEADRSVTTLLLPEEY